MAQVTQKGRALALEIIEQGYPDLKGEHWQAVKEIASLLHRHSKTLRNLIEIDCGDGIHSGEWVNANHDWIEKRYAQTEKRIESLVDSLPLSNGQKVTAQIGGDPRGFVVRLFLTNKYGWTVTVGVD